MDQLDQVIEILSSNQLFLPAFFKETKEGVDSDVTKWLNAMVLQTNAPESSNLIDVDNL